MHLRLVALFAWLALPATPARAQVTSPASATTALRVFLDCDVGCDFDYLRVETPWVAFVRDRAVADVHLLVVRQETGAGGRQYTIRALGREAFAGRADTLLFATEPGTTEDVRRAEVLRHIQLALVPFATRTGPGRSLRVVAATRDDEDDERPAGPDRWNAWVFEIGGGGGMEREQQQSDFSVNGELSARRITSALKLGVELDANFDRSRYTRRGRSGVQPHVRVDLQLGGGSALRHGAG